MRNMLEERSWKQRMNPERKRELESGIENEREQRKTDYNEEKTNE